MKSVSFGVAVHAPIITVVQRSEWAKVWNRVVAERADARAGRFGVRSGARPAGAGHGAVRAEIACGKIARVESSPTPHAGKDCSTYHYKILRSGWRTGPYNCGNSVASTMCCGFRLVAEENANAKAATDSVQLLARLRPFGERLPVLDARGSRSTSPWPARGKRVAGKMF